MNTAPITVRNRNPRTKPNNRLLRYDPGYWSRMGLPQPSLFMPMFGPGRKGGVNDYSPNHNDGTLNGGVSWVGGSGGMGLKFDGSSGYVNVGRPASLVLNRSFSLSVWVNPSVSSGALGIFSHGGSGFYVRLSNGSVQVLQSQVAVIVAGGTVPAGKSSLVTVTVGAGSTASVVIYVNGQFAASGTTSASFSSASNISIGADLSGATEFFNGFLDQPFVPPYALTPSQALSLYNPPWQMFGGREVVVAAPSTARHFGGILSGGGLGGGIMTGGRMAA